MVVGMVLAGSGMQVDWRMGGVRVKNLASLGEAGNMSE